MEEYKQRFHVLELEYLGNQLFASCYIGGPHGWCDLKGNIFQSDKNVGKWPSVGEVLEDWAKIAERLPFLSLRAQLFNYEAGEDTLEDRPREAVVEYVVKDGGVTLRYPGEEITYKSRNVVEEFIQDVSQRGLLSRERGISKEDLVEKFSRYKTILAERGELHV
jgi:hypothetical protein